MFVFIIGFILGVLTLLIIQFLYLFISFGPTVEDTFSQQFVPFRIPFELKQILISPNRDEQLKKKESCISVNLLLQFLYQEFRDSKSFRRWMLKKLQMEFNELLSRSASGKLLKDIKLRSLTTGHQFPVIKNIHAQNVQLSEDENSFETMDLVLDVEYRGGFEISVDVVALLGQQASLSVNVTKLAGEARLQLSRRPYSHWSFSFVQDPTMDFKVDSKFHGRPLPHLVPLIINQFRRTVRKRHVLPAYKLRFRPFFHNPLFQPSPDPNDFSHISMAGCLKLTVLNCSRLNISVVPTGHVDLYCALMTVAKPHIFGQQSNFVSIAIKFVRYSAVEPFGLTLGREFIPEKGSKQISVVNVEKGTTADRAGFQNGDLILAVNNICILTERQAAKMLSNTVGEMIAIVERELSKIDNEDEVMDQLSNSMFNLTGQQNGGVDKNIKAELNSDGFIHVNYDSPTTSDDSSTGNTLLKAKSFADLTKSSEESTIKNYHGAPTLNVEQHFDGNDDGGDNKSDDQDSNISGLRKVRSASVFVVPASPPDNFPAANNQPHQQDLRSDSRSVESGGLEFVASSSDVDSMSVSSESPHLSRKQRIAERAAQVAQKFSSGKANVKDMIVKRIKRNDESVTSFSSTAQIQKRKTESSIDSGGQIFVPASKSEEAQLGLRVNTSNMHASVTRTRSKSEPDTMVLAVNGGRSRDNSSSESEFSKSDGFKKEDDDKDKTSFNSNEKAPVNETSTEIKPPPKKIFKPFEKSTKSLEINENPSWNESVTVPLDQRLKYLNVLVYTKPKSNTSSKKLPADNPFLLGYINILLPEALEDCGTTKSFYHQQTYALRPSGFPKVPTSYQHLSRHPGFDSRLCYGDITIGFQWLPDLTADDAETDAQVTFKDEKPIAQEPNGDANQPVFMDGHKWMSTHFQHATTCDVCQKKIWLKTAFKCPDCLMISHKKCLPRVAALGRCGQVLVASATDRQHSAKDSWNTEEIVEAVEAVAAALESTTPEHSPASNPGRRLHLQHLLAEKFSGLRRRRGRGEANKTETESKYAMNGSDPVLNPVVMPTLEDVTGGQWSSNDSPFHSMLYTKGGTYNERMIYAAKDLGKDLFVDLELVERKAKINEEIDKLQGEIDAAIQQRLEVLTKNKIADQNSLMKNQLQQEIIKFDDRLQALAILMLHYCAGLQHCLDLEEANAAVTSSEQNNENGESIFDDLATMDSAEKSHTNDVDENISEENFMNYYNNNNV